MDHAPSITAADQSLDSFPESTGERALTLPAVDSLWRYAGAYAYAALKGIAGSHRLRLDTLHSYGTAVHISARLAHRWRALFDVPSRASAVVPLATHQSASTLLQARLFTDLGLNLRRLRHMQHRTVHHAGVGVCSRARQYRLSCAVHRVLRMGERAALLQVQTQVQSADGELWSMVEDGFLIEGLPESDLLALPSDCMVLREVLGLRRRLPRLSTTTGDALVSEMRVPSDMGREYGRISGDLSPIHSSRVGAWLFGLKGPFLQGLALRNLVVRHLAELQLPLDRLSLTFAAPAAVGQTLLLVALGSEVEVHDEAGRLVAFGSSLAH